MTDTMQISCGTADWPRYWFFNTQDLEADLWRFAPDRCDDLWPHPSAEAPDLPAVDPSTYSRGGGGEVQIVVGGRPVCGLMGEVALDAHRDFRLPAIYAPDADRLYVSFRSWHPWDARPVPGSRRGDHGLSEAEWPTDPAGLAAIVARYLRAARTDLDPADRDRLLDWFVESAAAPWHDRPTGRATTGGDEVVPDEEFLAELRLLTAEWEPAAAVAKDAEVELRSAYVDRLSRLSTSFDAALSALVQSPDYRSRADAPILCEWLAQAMLELSEVDPEDTLARARRFAEGRVAQRGRPDLYPLLLRLRSGVGVGDRAPEASRIGRIAHDLGMSRVELSDILHAQYTPTLAPDWCAVHRGVLRGFDECAPRNPDSLDRSGLFPAEIDPQVRDAASAKSGLAAASIAVPADEEPAPVPHILIQVSGGMVEEVLGTAPFRVTLQDFDAEDVTGEEGPAPVLWDAVSGVVVDPTRFEQELRGRS